ncbi:T9SS type A sorting domain-containing protein [Flavobacterium sp. RSB2_4_14]|uniref:T9SS type A sorting domain-containing protein n=1 Tax=Flavobacterium sp. RSB2_4_14 TaxID=3447665 RepID=UPI003F3AE39B
MILHLPYTNFRLTSLTTLPLTYATKYYVSVQAIVTIDGQDYASGFGTVCEITTPNVVAKQTANAEITDAFSAVAYPNPFANNFMIDVTTSTKETINIKVYDMVGRLIEQRDTTPNDLENLAIGDRYPSGVYNVNITQGEEMKTLRVVKR